VEDKIIQWFMSGSSYQDQMVMGLDCGNVMVDFNSLARSIERNVPHGPERTVALRKLLEAKDAVARAIMAPGG